MTVCFELKISPFQAHDMYFDDIDYLGIIGYYDHIIEDHKKTKQKLGNNG